MKEKSVVRYWFPLQKITLTESVNKNYELTFVFLLNYSMHKKPLTLHVQDYLMFFWFGRPGTMTEKNVPYWRYL